MPEPIEPPNPDDVTEIPKGQRADGTVEDPPNPDDPPEDADTFPREYVERLRTESAEHRTKAKEATEALEPLQRQVHALLVEKSGRLADPTDLAFDAAHLESEAALTQAIDSLLEAKPHLASRRVAGDIGQGAGEPKQGVNLAGLLSAGA